MTRLPVRRLLPRGTPIPIACGVMLLAMGIRDLPAQILTIGPNSTYARYATIQPTHIDLPNNRLTGKTRQELLRLLQAEQGFAVRPVPKGSRGLVLRANGSFDPDGTNYLHALEEKGVSVKPGDRVVITDVKIEHNRIVFDLNGGPDRKHKWLRHIEIGTSTTTPIVNDQAEEPVGSRVTLLFEREVPELTGAQVKALFGPILDFTFKTPLQAFVDPLPPKLKNAILNHEVLVGMSTEMVIYAIGKPDHKSREIEGQMPYEEWIYGEPPKDVEFVRINGNRVIRVEIAKLGQELVIRDKNEVEGMVQPEEAHTHQVRLGDVPSDQDTARQAPPSLKNPGEKLPSDTSPGAMGPVQFPKDLGKDRQIPPDLQQPPVTSDPASSNPASNDSAPK
ncbi:MAG TPA: hypothetical protein VM554_15310 [Acidisarcina sp.]|nr:hypothetical protein [Acidisarcina sp.]